MNTKKLRIYTYIGAVFMALYSSIPAYINSSFLKSFLGEKGIGWLYSATSLITIILMLVAPWLIKRFGNKNVLVGFIGLSILSTIPLAYPTQKVIHSIHSLTAFGIYVILGYLTRYTLDVYLENISDNKGTGFIRGLYMTFYNLAWLISPLLATYLVSQGNYNLVYGVAGLALIPFFLIAVFGLKENRSAKKSDNNVWLEIKYLWAEKTQIARNIRGILLIDFLLNFFYAVTVIYMPIYLHDHIGLSWAQIGLAFTIMLIPFVLFELPLGKIADQWLGEKELLIGGIIIIALSTMATSFLTLPNWILWAIILFLTRTGASTIEIMKETYLFKKIDGIDTGIISLSRINVPFSYLAGSVFATIIFFFLDLRYLFLCLGLVMLLGLKFAWGLKDTK
ncbi:MAG: MFS transporter [Candidatus Paceibacterota bacterium]|jgi:MFS family permease